MIDLYGGDGVYTLTPLTMLNRFGRGGSFSAFRAPFEVKGLYVQDTSSLPQMAFGGDLSYAPISSLALTASLLQNRLTHKSEKILNSPQNNLSHSLMALLKNDKIGEHTLEYAKTGSLFSHEKEQSSYYLYSRATPLNNLWYAIQNIYAEPEFVGYYQDTSQLYTSLGFPLIKKLQGTVSYNMIKYNLKENPLNGSAPRNHSAYGGLSYSFPTGLYTSAYYNFFQSKNKISATGYQTHYFSLNGGQSFNKWTLQGIIEYGSYHELKPNHSSNLWQNYQIYTYYQPTARLQYALYTRIGYIQLAEEINWARIYGTSCAWSSPQRLKLQLLYEYTDQENYRNYLSSLAEYTLANKHSFKLQGYWNKDKKYNNTLEFLLSYTIPWELPLRKNKRAGTIQGKVSKKEIGNEESAFPNLVVNCNGMRTLTDSKGNFTFPSLQPGSYHIWTEETAQDLISSSTPPIQVQGGKISQAMIHFDHPGSITGKIPLFDFFQNTLEQTGSLQNATVLLTSAASGEKLISTTDHQGVFSFDKLAPGRWILTVLSQNMPPYHYFESKELLVDLFPGQTKELELKLLPIKRQLRMIDQTEIPIQPRN